METSQPCRRSLLKSGAAAAALAALGAVSPSRAASSQKFIDQYTEYDGLGLARLVRKREVSAEELLDAAIERTEAFNPDINAVVLKYYDLARDQIRQGLPSSPFSGVPFLLKDLGIQMSGTQTTAGNIVSKGLPAAVSDSALVERYKAAGLVIFGKTATPEFGLTATTESKLHGATRNPWNPGRTAGGSSGGSAAAVCAGFVPMAHASDGGGSIRTPASCCGLFGMKPSRARVPLGPPRVEHWQGLTVAHAITRSVRDSAALLDISQGPEAGAPYWAPPPTRPYLDEIRRSPGRLRIALAKSPPAGSPVDPACLEGLDAAAKLCEDLGHEVDEAQPQLDAEALNQAMSSTMSVETRRRVQSLAVQLGRAPTAEEFEMVTWALYQLGAQVPATAYAQARTVFYQAGQTMAAFMKDYDVLLSPTLAKPPVPLGLLSLSPENLDTYVQEVTTFGPFTALFNQTGQPSMSVPLHWTADGLPVGMMFSARFGDEATLFRLAAQLEEAKPWASRRPPLTA